MKALSLLDTLPLRLHRIEETLTFLRIERISYLKIFAALNISSLTLSTRVTNGEAEGYSILSGSALRRSESFQFIFQ